MLATMTIKVLVLVSHARGAGVALKDLRAMADFSAVVGDFPIDHGSVYVLSSITAGKAIRVQ